MNTVTEQEMDACKILRQSSTNKKTNITELYGAPEQYFNVCTVSMYAHSLKQRFVTSLLQYK